MRNPFEQFFNNKEKEVFLSLRDKDQIRREIISYMRKTSFDEVQSNLNWFVFLSRHSVAVTLVLVLFFSTGALSVFAEKALPGDFLYPLKTGVTEQVRGWLAVSSEDKAEWQLTLAERRYQEMAYVSEIPTISAEIKSEVKAKLETEISKIEDSEKESGKSEITLFIEEEKSASSYINTDFKSSSFVITPTAEERINNVKIQLQNLEEKLTKLNIQDKEKLIKIKSLILITKKTLSFDTKESLVLQSADMTEKFLRKAENNILRLQNYFNEEVHENTDDKKTDKSLIEVNGTSAVEDEVTVEVQNKQPGGNEGQNRTEEKDLEENPVTSQQQDPVRLIDEI
ncbi:MAG TPA: hypothetical protein VJC12_00265 [Candidatus Paceibacterota bacterium]